MTRANERVMLVAVGDDGELVPLKATTGGILHTDAVLNVENLELNVNPDVTDRDNRLLGHVHVDSIVPVALDAATLAALEDTGDSVAQALLEELVDHEIPLASYDPNNFHSAAFTGNETWMGDWTPYGEYPGMITLVLMDSQPVSVAIEWSADGINKDTSALGTTPFLIQKSSTLGNTWTATFVNNLPVNKFYRLKIVNGATPGSTFGHARVWRLREAFGGNFAPVASIPTNFSVALLTRAIHTGIAADGSFVNIPVGGHDPDNSTMAALGVAGDFTGVYKPSSGLSSLFTFVIADQPLTAARIEWSPDGVNPTGGIIGTSSFLGSVQVIPTGVPGQNAYVYLSVLTTLIDKYYRLHLINGANAQVAFHQADVFTYDKPFTGSFGSLTDMLSNFSTALITRAVTVGRKPDGSYINQPETGVSALNNTSTPLAANATYTGDWELVDQYSGVAVNVISDVPSATGGLKIQYSQDAAAVTRDVDYEYKLAPKGATYGSSVQARYVRVVYVNGGTGQATFSLQTRFLEEPLVGGTTPLGEALTDATLAEHMRAVITAKRINDGVFVNVPASPTGGIQVDPEALPNLLIAQTAVGTSAVQIAVTGVLRRKTISIKALSSNNGIVYLGTSNAVLETTGYPLSAGDSVEIDLATGQALWVLADRVNQRVATMEVSS